MSKKWACCNVPYLFTDSVQKTGKIEMVICSKLIDEETVLLVRKVFVL